MPAFKISVVSCVREPWGSAWAPYTVVSECLSLVFLNLIMTEVSLLEQFISSESFFHNQFNNRASWEVSRLLLIDYTQSVAWLFAHREIERRPARGGRRGGRTAVKFCFNYSSPLVSLFLCECSGTAVMCWNSLLDSLASDGFVWRTVTDKDDGWIDQWNRTSQSHQRDYLYFVIGWRLDVSLDRVMSREMKSEFLIYALSCVSRKTTTKKKLLTGC